MVKGKCGRLFVVIPLTAHCTLILTCNVHLWIDELMYNLAPSSKIHCHHNLESGVTIYHDCKRLFNRFTCHLNPTWVIEWQIECRLFDSIYNFYNCISSFLQSMSLQAHKKQTAIEWIIVKINVNTYTYTLIHTS